MATNTYVALKSTTLTSATGIVTFDLAGISGYTDLRIVVSARGTTTAYCAPSIQFNSDTSSSGTNYSWTAMFGDGYSPISYRVSNQYLISGEQIPRSNDTAGLFGLVTFDVMNYSNSTTHKTVLVRNSSLGSTCVPLAAVGLWRAASPTPITYITIISGTPNFEVGSTFTVYGISNAGQESPKAIGGVVTSDDTYWYHTFEMSGNFTAKQSFSCDYLVIAGGGGGFGSYLGGGGSGGYRTTVGTSGGGASAESQLSVTAGTTYPAIVGAGGTAGGKGSNSTLGSIVSIGGGGAAASPKDGGSGAGGGAQTISPTPGSGTTGQGYAGGSGASNNSTSAGGGGAGGAGGSNASSGGTGGAGLTSSISGTSVARGGGGGGGADSGYGTGGTATAGGGAGSINGTATAGTANTGGGGGSPYTGTGGNGGSGIIIVRYPK